jgi:hypothetical protein
MKPLLFFLSCFLLIVPNIILSQEFENVNGTYRMKQEDNMTREETLKKAEEFAKIDAIEGKFGTLVDKESSIRIKDSKDSFSLIAGTKVKGEWIETINKEFIVECYPFNKDGFKNTEIYITCTIEGKARKAQSRPAIEIETRRCKQPECEASIFSNGDLFYLSFKSPVSGYLSIFDEAGDATMRLFPYNSMKTESCFKVDGDKEYIFFSKDKEHDFFPGYDVDEIKLTTDRDREYNIIYVVFSESGFLKPILSDIKTIGEGEMLPRSMRTEDFKAWLSKNSMEKMDFHWVERQITIEKN